MCGILRKVALCKEGGDSVLVILNVVSWRLKLGGELFSVDGSIAKDGYGGESLTYCTVDGISRRD